MPAGLGLLALGGLILAPLVTFWPVVARRYPQLGLPPYPLAVGCDLWGEHVFRLVGLVALATLIAPGDFWLGVAVLWVALSSFFRGHMIDHSQHYRFALGCLFLVGVRELPASLAPQLRWLLVALGTFQALYVLQQWAGYDLFWGLFRRHPGKVQPWGTLGSVVSTALYVAICAPLMPFWLMLGAVGVIFFTHSLGALLAVAVALGVLAKLTWWGWFLAVVIATAFLEVFRATGHRLNKDSHYARLAVWGFAFRRWIKDPVAVIFGWGLGGWKVVVPMAQQEINWFPYKETWAEAHNEPLQWVFETGLIGAAIAGLWFWAHPGLFRDPAVMALAVGSLTWFPFHVPALAFLGIVVVGLSGA